MPRRKISEFRAKQLVATALEIPYQGWAIDTESAIAAQLPPDGAASSYAVKVDQGVKGRFKAGLVLLGVSQVDLIKATKELQNKGYRHLLIEPMVGGGGTGERYLSLARTRDGVVLSHSRRGGIEVEAHTDAMNRLLLGAETDWAHIARETSLSTQQLYTLRDLFEAQHMTLLEVNPYVMRPYGLKCIDLAVEVDDSAAFFIEGGWTKEDFRRASGSMTPQEILVQKLGEKSPASFKLDVLNPDGAVFLLLSGGGASIVVADEVHTMGFGHELANYGEYSGNPNAEETYAYTGAVLSLLLASKAPRKVLFIGGAVANFTDIATTFTGVIKAIDAVAAKLKKQHVKVFVRRGGPRQEIGLAKIEVALKKHSLLGSVHGPTRPLVSVVQYAVQEIAS